MMDGQPPPLPALTHVLGVQTHTAPAAAQSCWLRSCPQSNGDERSLHVTKHPSPQLDAQGSGVPAQPTSHVQDGGDTHWLYPTFKPHTGDDPEHPSGCNRHPAASHVPVPCMLHPGSGSHAVAHAAGDKEEDPPTLEDGAGGPLLLESTADDDDAPAEEDAATDVEPATDEDDAREEDDTGVDELCRPLLDATREEEPGRDDELPAWEEPLRLEEDPATDAPEALDTIPPLELLAPATLPAWHLPSSHTAPGSQSALFWQVVFTEQPQRPPNANATTTQPTRVCPKTTPPARQHSAPVVTVVPCRRVSNPRHQNTCP